MGFPGAKFWHSSKVSRNVHGKTSFEASGTFRILPHDLVQEHLSGRYFLPPRWSIR